MYISGINFYNAYPQIRNRNNIRPSAPLYCPKNKFKRGSVPAFTGLNFIHKLFPPIKKLKKYSIKEYSNLSEAEINYLRKEYSKVFPEDDKNFANNIEVIHDFVSDALKKDYDEKYGKGAYVVIPIGRSVSSIGKVLGYKIGEDNVRYLPMSNAGIFTSSDTIARLKGSSRFKIFEKYLKTLGLSDEHLTFSKKKYILLDFCVSGKSLAGVKNLLGSFIEQQDKLVYDDVMSHVKEPKMKQYTFDYLLGEDFKFLSVVTKSTRLEDPFNSFVNLDYIQPKTKLTWFKLLDNYMTGADSKNKPLLRDIKRAGTQ